MNEDNMTKIVINNCYGGFGLSDEAIRLYLDLKGFAYKVKRISNLYNHYVVEGLDNFYADDLERDDLVLIEVVEKLGEKANGLCAKLAITELPKGTLYRINGFDGLESIEIRDNTEWKIA